MLELVRFKKQDYIHLLMCGFISEILPPVYSSNRN